MIAAIRPVVFDVAGATTDEEREAVASSIEPSLEKTRKECESSWSPAYRRCAHAARSEESLFACDRDAAIERGEDLGGPSCEQVADHLTKITIDPIGPKSDHRAELHARFVTYCQPWGRARKECVLAASTTDAIAACGES